MVSATYITEHNEFFFIKQTIECHLRPNVSFALLHFAWWWYMVAHRATSLVFFFFAKSLRNFTLERCKRKFYVRCDSVHMRWDWRVVKFNEPPKWLFTLWFLNSLFQSAKKGKTVKESKVCRSRDYYENCLLLAPNGEKLWYLNSAKAFWYLAKNLGGKQFEYFHSHCCVSLLI